MGVDESTHLFRAAGEGLVSALTFDDGPNGRDTMRLLDFLAAHRLPAVFCVVGQCIEAPAGAHGPSGAEVLRRIVAEGHVIANHSTSFADMGDWDAERVREDLSRNNEIIRSVVGDVDIPYWRAPNGSWGVTVEVAREFGMKPLSVRNAIGDWITQDTPTLTERLRAVMVPGDIVLVHDGGGDRAGSVAAVETVVEERLAQGWQFTLPANEP
jgi:endo-1,4-beta-xylanase